MSLISWISRNESVIYTALGPDATDQRGKSVVLIRTLSQDRATSEGFEVEEGYVNRHPGFSYVLK